MENGATGVLPAGVDSSTLWRTAKQQLCAWLPRYDRLIVTRHVVARDAMVRVDGRSRAVGEHELPALFYLGERAGRVVSAAEMASNATGTTVAEPTVRKWIERLRNALGDTNRSIVLGLHREGYMMERMSP